MSFYHTCTLQLTRMRYLIQAQASSLWCMCFLSKCLRWVSNVYVCYDQTHTLVFGQRCVFILRIHRNWYACVLLFKHMCHICDVCVSCADVFVVFLTYMCNLTQHMRSFSDIEDVEQTYSSSFPRMRSFILLATWHLRCICWSRKRLLRVSYIYAFLSTVLCFDHMYTSLFTRLCLFNIAQTLLYWCMCLHSRWLRVFVPTYTQVFWHIYFLSIHLRIYLSVNV
jgi:hypothetical protein